MAAAAERKVDLFMAHMGEAAFEEAVRLARDLRRQGITCHLEFAGGSLKSQLRLANKIAARHVLIIGEDELKRNIYQVRRMQDSSQWEIPPSDLVGYLVSARGDAAK